MHPIFNLKDKVYKYITSHPVVKTCINLSKYKEKLIEKFALEKSFEGKKNELDKSVEQPDQSIQQLVDLISVKAQEYLNPSNTNKQQNKCIN